MLIGSIAPYRQRGQHYEPKPHLPIRGYAHWDSGHFGVLSLYKKLCGFPDIQREGMKGCRSLNDEELRRVLEQLGKMRYPDRNRALFLLGVRSGFRISELLSLRVGDVLQNGTFVSEIAVARRNMKKKTEGRTVDLHDEARQAIQTHVERLPIKEPDVFLFQSQKGINKPMNRRSAWELLKKAYAKCGLAGKLATHSMRKTFARRVYEASGHDLLVTQEAMGHAEVTSTVKYLSFSKAKVKDAILKS